MKNEFLLGLFKRHGVEAEAKPEAVAELQAAFDAYKLEAEANLKAVGDTLSSALEAVKAADEKIASLQAALDAVEAAKAEAAKVAEEKRLAARKEKIVKAVGEAKADGLMAATSALADEQFEAVVGALVASVDTEANSPMFTETGATGIPDANKVTDAAAGTMAALKQIQGE